MFTSFFSQQTEMDSARSDHHLREKENSFTPEDLSKPQSKSKRTYDEYERRNDELLKKNSKEVRITEQEYKDHRRKLREERDRDAKKELEEINRSQRDIATEDMKEYYKESCGNIQFRAKGDLDEFE